MSATRFRSLLQQASLVALACGLAGGLVRAGQNPKFEQARNNLYNQARAEQQRSGLTNDQKKLYADYPCPELPLFKLQNTAPGSTMPVVLTGKFPKGTTFLTDNDGTTLTGTLTGNTYTGSLTIGASQLPSFVHVYAFTPVSNGYGMIPVAFIDGAYAFDLRGPNGWTIKATPAAKTFTLSPQEASLAYRVEFTRPGEAKPFETMSGQLRYSAGASASSEVQITLQAQASGAQAEMEAITKQMSDMQAFLKLTDAQREALLDRMSKLTDQMMKEAMAGMSDPAAAQKKQDDFGCRELVLKAGASGTASGQVMCGRNVNNGVLNLTGTMNAAK